MSRSWDFDLNPKLEKSLLDILITGPKNLKEIAKEIGFQIKNNSDKAVLKYRMRKIVGRNDELMYFGYTSDGYIVPRYFDEFAKLIKPLKNRGEGMLYKVELLKQGARKVGKRREDQPEQLGLFEDFFGAGS